MITQLGIRNFRSIEEADIQLGRINVFYGPTASGKSSVLYALLVLKNFVANPNRRGRRPSSIWASRISGASTRACSITSEIAECLWPARWHPAPAKPGITSVLARMTLSLNSEPPDLTSRLFWTPPTSC
jgi:hypothetical protein